MSLAVRVIPILLTRGEHLVKGKQFKSWRVIGHALQAARIHAARGVDELLILDISATPEGRGPNCKLIEKLANDCFMPLTVGGGVRSVQDVRDLLNAGADKVAICTGGPKLISHVTQRFGSQAVTAVADSRLGRAHVRCGSHMTMQPILRWAKSCVEHGAGEVLIQDIEKDGTMEGYSLGLINQVAHAVSAPVVAAGGCSGYADMAHAVATGASAVAAGALYAFSDATPKGASEYLQSHGIEARVA